MTLKRFSGWVLSLVFCCFAFAWAEEGVGKKIKSEVAKKYEEVFPEDDYKIINISRTDINRIYCPSGISYYQTSAEKYLAISFSETDKDAIKKNMFLKIKPKIIMSESGIEEKLIYNDSPKELYLKCGETLYTFILKPMNIPARTIYIKGTSSSSNTEDLKNDNGLEKDTEKPFQKQVAKSNTDNRSQKITNTVSLESKGNYEEAVSFEKSINSYEQTLLAIVRSILKKGTVPGYSEYKYLGIVDKFKQGTLVLNKIYEGPSYRAYLYTFIASKDINKPLREVDFAYLSKKPLAISLSDLTLRKGESMSVVIVESLKTPIIVVNFEEAKK